MAIEVGGKIQCPGCKTSLGFESIVLKILDLESCCTTAKQAVKDKLSVDSDFLPDEKIAQKLKALDESFLTARDALKKMLAAHRGIRGIHQNRQEMKRRLQNLKELEDRLL